MKSVNYLFILIFLLLNSCKTSEIETIKSSEKEITSIELSGITGSSSSFDKPTNTYTFTVPVGTNLKAIPFSITISAKATANPKSGSVLDFTNPLNCTITAEDGTSVKYTIRVVIQNAPKSSAKQILSFSFDELNPVIKASINQATFEITAEVPSNANLKSLKPTITLSDKASVSPTLGSVQDFTNSIKYTVTAEDGSKQIYTSKISQLTNISNSLEMVYFKSSINTDFSEFRQSEFIYGINGSSGIKIFSAGFAQKGMSNIKITKDYIFYKALFQTGNSLAVYGLNSNTAKYELGIGDSKISLPNVNGDNQDSFNSVEADEDNLAVVGGKGLYFLKISKPSTLLELKWNNSNYYNFYNIAIRKNIVFGNDVNSRKFIAIDLNTNKLLWDYPIDANLSVSNDGVYFSDKTGKTSLLDHKSGKVLWTINDYNSIPFSSNGLVYLTNNNDISAFKVSDGTKQWSIKWDNKLNISKIISIDGKKIYVQRNSENLADLYLYTALDALNGTMLWQNNIPYLSNKSVIVDDIYYYVSDSFGIYTNTTLGVHSYNVKNNSKIWSFTPVKEDIPQNFSNSFTIGSLFNLNIRAKDGKIYPRFHD